MPTKTELDHADPFEAFRRLVYLHDVKRLAPRLGMKVGTLYNKADADADSHNQPTLRDVVALTQITGDTRVLDALNEMFGRAAFDVSEFGLKSDDALLELVSTLAAENGELHTALRDGLRSKTFTAMHLHSIRAEAFDLVAAVMTLLHRLEGLVDD